MPKVIAVEWSGAQLSIEFDGLPHLLLQPPADPGGPYGRRISFQSWIDASKTKRLYCIEYYFGTQAVTTEYEEESIWRTILSRLDTIFVQRTA